MSLSDFFNMFLADNRPKVSRPPYSRIGTNYDPGTISGFSSPTVTALDARRQEIANLAAQMEEDRFAAGSNMPALDVLYEDAAGIGAKKMPVYGGAAKPTQALLPKGGGLGLGSFTTGPVGSASPQSISDYTKQIRKNISKNIEIPKEFDLITESTKGPSSEPQKFQKELEDLQSSMSGIGSLRGAFSESGDTAEKQPSPAEQLAAIENKKPGVGLGSFTTAGGEDVSSAKEKSAKQSGSAIQDYNDPFEQLVADSMKSVEEAKTGMKSEGKSIEDYKKDFAEATGIDVSGKVDKSQALMALGLALMQNKAGKGFDVGKMLDSVGQAGEKAMPLLAEAKKEARAAQVAGGKYALDQIAADKAQKAAVFKSESENLGELLKSQAEGQAKYQVEALKAQTDYNLKIMELEAEAAKELAEGGKVELKNKDAITDPGLPGISLTVMTDQYGNAKLPYASMQVKTIGSALADVNEGIDSVDLMRNAITPFVSGGGGITMQKAKELAQSVAGSFGYDLFEVPQFDKDGNYIGTKRDEKPLDTADAIRQRIILQFKRFLTQETGNGISNVDIQNVEDALGKVDFLKDPASALVRLDEIEKIFLSKQAKIGGMFDIASDRSRYLSDDEYNKAMEAMQQAGAAAYAGFQMTTDEDTGLKTYKIS